MLEEDSKTILYSPTCRHHKTFFDTWTKRLPRLGYAIEWSCMYNHVQRVLEQGIVEVKKEDIEGLPVDRYTHLILLCAKYVEGFKRSWNPALFDRCLKNIWWQVFAVGPVNVSVEDLLVLLKAYDEPLVQSFYTVLTKFPDTGYQEPQEDQWLHVIEVLVKNSYLKWEPELLNPEHLKVLKEKTRRWARLQSLIENGSLEEKLRSSKMNFYKCQKESIQTVKEELMEVTWHPDRFMKWCMDWVEKKWLTSQW